MPIKMYSTSWCPDCFRAKRFLSQRDVAYEEIDIDREPDAAQLVMEHNDGKRRVPTFEIGGEYHGNPPLSKLATLLDVPY